MDNKVKMKKKYLVLFALISSLQFYGQSWEWAVKSTHTSDWQKPEKICTDNNGHVFVLGLNHGSAQFNTAIVNSGSYLIKYSSNGILIWARKIEGSPTEINLPPTAK